MNSSRAMSTAEDPTIKIVIAAYNIFHSSKKHSRRIMIYKRMIEILKQKQMFHSKNRKILITLLKYLKGQNTYRGCWVRQELLQSHGKSFWEQVVPFHDDYTFQKTFRLSKKTFTYLCKELRPYLIRKDTKFRSAISVEKRIAVAITVLQGNCHFWTVANLFAVGTSTVHVCLYEFCEALIERFYNIKVKFPLTNIEQEAISEGFLHKWQFPGCFGVLDSCHIPIVAPSEYSEDYYNCQSFYSIIMLIVVDYNYRFTYLNVGRPGCCNDEFAFRSCNLYKHFEKHPPNINKHIINERDLPLLPWLMKPYPVTEDLELKNKNYNCCLRFACTAVEKALRKLKARWKILLKRANFDLANIKKIVKSCIILHNICEENADQILPEWLEQANDLEKKYRYPVTESYGSYETMQMQAALKRDALVIALLNGGTYVS